MVISEGIGIFNFFKSIDSFLIINCFSPQNVFGTEKAAGTAMKLM